MIFQIFHVGLEYCETCQPSITWDATSWNLSDTFLTSRLKLWVGGREITESKYRFHQIISINRLLNSNILKFVFYSCSQSQSISRNLTFFFFFFYLTSCPFLRCLCPWFFFFFFWYFLLFLIHPTSRYSYITFPTNSYHRPSISLLDSPCPSPFFQKPSG